MRLHRCLPIAAVVLLTPSLAAAQVWEVGDQLLELASPAAYAFFGGAMAVGDFDGDGVDDLAIGAPGPGTNEVVLFRGTAAGLDAGAWPPLAPAVGDSYFGDALAAGDFDGDGRDELAVGAPLYDNVVSLVPIENSGRVFVYDLSGGVWSQVGSFSQAGPDLEDSAETGDRFGDTLVAADFGDDGFDDLAIGVPNDSIAGVATAGLVHVLYGGPAGLSAVGSQIWHRSGGGVIGVASAAKLGSALASGDFDGDGVGDLAIGAPSVAADGTTAGEVVVLYGVDDFGLASTDQQAIAPSDYAAAQNGMGFGAALAAGDLNWTPLCESLGNCADDLAIGARSEDVNWQEQLIDSAGAVYIAYGSQNGNGLDEVVAERFDASKLDPDSATPPETNDFFGSVLAIGQLDGRRGDDLAIGTPNEAFGTAAAAGVAHLLFAGSSPFSNGAHQFLYARSGYASFPVTAGNRFGSTLAIGDFDDDGVGDLAVGIPYRTADGWLEAGAVQILYGALFADGFERATTGGWTTAVP
jgi:hypothetical protein